MVCPKTYSAGNISKEKKTRVLVRNSSAIISESGSFSEKMKRNSFNVNRAKRKSAFNEDVTMP